MWSQKPLGKRLSQIFYTTFLKSGNKDKKKTEIGDDKPEKKIKSTQIDNILISINKSDYTELQNDVKEMKNEIKDLKNTIKELVEMMKAVYDFEDA